MKKLIAYSVLFSTMMLAGSTLASPSSEAARLALTAIGKADAKLEFLAQGPLGLKIVGESKGHLDAQEKDGKVSVVASMKHFDTGIELRDNHLRETIEADRYPTATLVVARSALKLPDDQQTLRGTAQGELTFHGKTKKTEFAYQLNRTGSDYHVKGKFDFKITDFGLEKPCHLGQCVDETVKIKTSFKLREK